MSYSSDPELLVPLALRLKGFGEVETISSVHGLGLDVVEAAFSSLGASSETLATVRRLGEHQCCRPLNGPETPIVARTDELGVSGVSIRRCKQIRAYSNRARRG